MRYCESIFQSKRWKTREVKVGKVGVGGDNPVRIQSMTTSSTRDVEGTVNQIIRLADAGCEIARVTVQGMKEADSCEAIKNALVQKGYEIPLVADIHFYPPAAMRVVDFVDKVRVNPGNFVDKRATFKLIEYDDLSYDAEIDRIEEAFSPLVDKCKRLGRAMRIGTNHGSLSDRIMNRYGDTPFGMVESALEFARVCVKMDYHDFMFSMKASNPIVMIQAYRLLVAEMIKIGWDYPLHLGVTEAGEGEDGRVKSAMGIGALLLDGIGDTIRVSLTEDPWEEIDPCRRLVHFAQSYMDKCTEPFEEKHRHIHAITRRSVLIPEQPPLHRDGSVVIPISSEALLKPELFSQLGCKSELGQWKRTLSTADYLLVDQIPHEDAYLSVIKKLHALEIGVLTRTPGIAFTTLIESLNDFQEGSVVLVHSSERASWEKLKKRSIPFILFSPQGSALHEGRAFFEFLQEAQLNIPTILHFQYAQCDSKVGNFAKLGASDLRPLKQPIFPMNIGDAGGLKDEDAKEGKKPTFELSCVNTDVWDDFAIRASAESGALLADALGEGICLQTPHAIDAVRLFSFNILQAARMRTSKTEYISCPGCGRTLFELQEVTKQIRDKTSHLPGVKIAIMGCIVNGPGEMADADFGYVGSKAGKIDLYVGKTCVERNIDMHIACERLIELIKSHGRWIERENFILA